MKFFQSDLLGMLTSMNKEKIKQTRKQVKSWYRVKSCKYIYFKSVAPSYLDD